MPPPTRDSDAEADLHVNSLLEGTIHVKDKAKAKAKQIFGSAKGLEQSEALNDESDIFSDPAFDPSSVIANASPESKKSTRDTITDGAKDVTYMVAHPRRVMRSKAAHIAAEKLGNARHPILTIDRDQELLEAHDILAKAASSNSSVSDFHEILNEVDGARERVEKIEQQRESLQTAWILGRHVSRVKAVRPVARPQRSEFTTTENGQSRLQWERYLGHLVLYYTRGFTSPYVDDFDSPPFDLEDLARIVERIAITSAPWQSFLVNVRQVYTWEDPKCTTRWLALFCILWYTEHIMGYFYFYVIYSTLRNKFRPSSIQTIRERVTRANDREARVQAWGELIQQHGRHDWLEPFLDEVGPLIQLQLGDVANFLEVLVNFHRHERPGLTMASMFFFSCCLLITLLTDMAFCMKLIWFIFGGGFFFTYPIATRFPKYRLLVSHYRWVFWDIPTHAELAIQRLQEKAMMKDADLAEFELRRSEGEQRSSEVDSDTENNESQSELHAFKVFEKTEGRGRLLINRTNLTFSTKTNRRSWDFSRLNEIRKLDDDDSESTLKNLRHIHSRSAEVVQFLFLDEPGLTLLLHPADRDRVFNLVLAWSGLRWQCLQMERHSKINSDRSNLDRAIKRAFY